jgi:aspartate/methionine/tyrosine aminotransferase
MIDAEKQLLPVAGSREGLFMIALSAVPEWAAASGRRSSFPTPSITSMPARPRSPGGTGVHAGGADSGFLPDIDRLTPSVLERTALAYICSPANPQGAVASLDYLQRWIELARRYNFVVAFDECYAEIYDRAAPVAASRLARGWAAISTMSSSFIRSPSARACPACARASSPAMRG